MKNKENSRNKDQKEDMKYTFNDNQWKNSSPAIIWDLPVQRGIPTSWWVHWLQQVLQEQPCNTFNLLRNPGLVGRKWPEESRRRKHRWQEVPESCPLEENRKDLMDGSRGRAKIGRPNQRMKKNYWFWKVRFIRSPTNSERPLPKILPRKRPRGWRRKPRWMTKEGMAGTEFTSEMQQMKE